VQFLNTKKDLPKT